MNINNHFNVSRSYEAQNAYNRRDVVKTKQKTSTIQDTYRPSTSNKDRVSFSNGPMDIGTARETTVRVNRGDYDRILSAAAQQKEVPIECGVDENKRWVVIDGQRFECEKSPEEKQLMREASKTLLDRIQEAQEKYDKEKKEPVSKTSDIASAVLTKRYGSADAAFSSDDIVYKVLKKAGIPV